MEINADGLFLKGEQHHVCEDYALFSKNEALSFAMVSDGCSGSPHTSVGARLIAHACRTVLLGMEAYELSHISHAGLGKKIISKAAEAAALIHDRTDILDATLICTFADTVNQRVIVMMYGDGSVTWKDKSGSVKHMCVDYPSGYPRYLSYLLDEERNKILLQKSPSGMNQTWLSSGEEPEVINMDIEQPTFVVIPMENLQWVMVSSDGLDTFFDSVAGRGLSKNAVLAELSSVKGLHGEFINRRVNRMVKQFQKNGICHGDDLSVAGLSFYEEEQQ